MKYEIEGMALIRRLVTGPRYGLSHEDVDGFKRVLTCLERNGFTLKGPDLSKGTNGV